MLYPVLIEEIIEISAHLTVQKRREPIGRDIKFISQIFDTVSRLQKGTLLFHQLIHLTYQVPDFLIAKIYRMMLFVFNFSQVEKAKEIS
jgi:hypothetical protein